MGDRGARRRPTVRYVWDVPILAFANFVRNVRAVPRWKAESETIPTRYRTFAAELIQSPFRQLTFRSAAYCCMGELPAPGNSQRTEGVPVNANEQF